MHTQVYNMEGSSCLSKMSECLIESLMRRVKGFTSMDLKVRYRLDSV
jgi:hypothetical protein